MRPKSLNKEQITKLLNDRKTMSYKKLGKKYGISKSSAWNYCSKYISKIHIQENMADSDEYIITVRTILDSLDFPLSLLFQGESSQEKQNYAHVKKFSAV
jgi:ACT domain-containing protein